MLSTQNASLADRCFVPMKIRIEMTGPAVTYEILLRIKET